MNMLQPRNNNKIRVKPLKSAAGGKRGSIPGTMLRSKTSQLQVRVRSQESAYSGPNHDIKDLPETQHFIEDSQAGYYNGVYAPQIQSQSTLTVKERPVAAEPGSQRIKSSKLGGTLKNATASQQFLINKLELQNIPKINAFIDPQISQFDVHDDTSKTDDAKQMHSLILKGNAQQAKNKDKVVEAIKRNIPAATLVSADVVNYYPVESEKSIKVEDLDDKVFNHYEVEPNIILS